MLLLLCNSIVPYPVGFIILFLHLSNVNLKRADMKKALPRAPSLASFFLFILN